ncbi:MAG: dihydroxyacetone kinase subunit DhaK [Lachnospiraceae bacterium]|nr:dihydroxyacetone kinase subunit DhaK [Lachnospiraceae bacterium]
MKKILNSPDTFIKDMLTGLYKAHSDVYTYVNDDIHSLVKKNITPGKVGLATGGGSGHLPLFLGYVGDGMLDGCSIGEVFQSSSAEQMHEVTKAIDTGAGVLYIYGNYGGDRMNFDMAAEMADFEDDIKVNTVIGRDDVSSNHKENRRGVAGIFFVYKVAGAAAAEMLSLEEVTRLAQKAADNVATMGVALSPCTIPRVGHPSFELAEDEMEIGMGIHGEAGIRRGKLDTADRIVDEMLEPVLADMDLQEGDEVAVLMNGLGATPLEEQYVSYNRVHEVLSEKGIKIFKVYTGEYATSMEMAGMSISLFKLDAELKKYLCRPANTPFFTQLQL